MIKAWRFGGSLVALAALAGCSGADESIAEGKPEPGPATDNSALTCGETVQFGETVPQVYYPESMARWLSRDELLRKDYGGTSVASCDDAQRFMDVFERHRERLAELEAEAEPIIDPAALPVEPVDKVLNGLRSRNPATIQWSYNNGAVAACSGVVIGPGTVLTSAHCISRVGWQEVSFRWQRTTGVPSEFMFPTAVWVYFTKHPSFVANGDSTYDVAVGTLWDTTFPDTARMRVWLGTATSASDVYYWGYGARALGGAFVGYQTQGTGVLRTVRNYWFDSLPDTNPPRTTCPGDSGGPQARYHSWEMLYGLTSKGDCASVSTATRVRYHMPWIEQTAGISCTRYSYNGEIYARCW